MTTRQTPIARGGDTASWATEPSRAVDRRREDLIEATLAVLAERGLAGATTRAITERAGLALGAFHHAFASKDELLAAVVERTAGTLDLLFGEEVESISPGPTTDDPAATLTDVLRRLWQAFEAAPGEQLAQFELLLHARREAGMVHLADRRQERLVAAIARAIHATPGPLDEAAIEELAWSAVDHLDGLLLHRLLDDDPDGSRRRFERYLAGMDAEVAAHTPVTRRATGR